MTEIRFDAVRSWMFEDALPFWAANGAGGPVAFHEICRLDGSPEPDAVRRVRVIARQVYVFSHAAMLGWNGPGLERAKAGVEALLSRVWLGEGKGWARLLDASGAVHDDRPDLYDFAFVLFALGWWIQASGDRGAQAYANATLDLIERTMPHPSGQGHVHMLPANPPYQQNPHMHLIEACLVLDRATGDPRWIAKARQVAQLFRDRFFEPGTQHLTEFFDEGWRPLGGNWGLIVEPGHQLEWAWILYHYMQRTGDDFSPEIRGLVDAAETHGVSPGTGLVYGAVSKDGGVLDSRHRIWPQTERIKGNLALFELTGADRSAPVAAATNALLDRYLAPAPRGAWIDVLDEDGKPVAGDIPASTFYHLFLAFAELLRLQPALEDARRAA
jgi:N-acylglucosamine 2-epimerase/mannose-6-phosphate isomerase